MKRSSAVLIIVLVVVLVVAIACKRVSITEYHIDSSSCNGCGECLRVCPNDAILYNHLGKAEIDQSKCTQCGECVAVCPNHAIY